MSSALQSFIRTARYARYLPEKKRRETWSEMVTRVMDMHKVFYAKQLLASPELNAEFNKVTQAMLDKKVLGSQRALQFGGSAVLNKHARMYNCTATYIDRARSFQEVVWLLLCGCGAGVSVQQHHIAKLPNITNPDPSDRKDFIIPDTIEGWANSVGVLLSSYFTSEQPHPEFAGHEVVFDFSEVRPKGSPISNMGGTAPGHQPLKKALGKIRGVIDRCLKSGRRALRPIDAFDIVMHSSDAVIAGGIRRSAVLTMFSLEDDEMMKAKTGNWFVDNPQRGRSNNSVVLMRDQVTREQFNSIIDSTRQMGEPGFIWTDDKEALYNPCVPANTMVMTDEGTKKVGNLVGVPFTALVDGRPYQSKGFFQTGVKQLLKLITDQDHDLRTTANHKIFAMRKADVEKDESNWIEMGDLKVGDYVKLHNHSTRIEENLQFSTGWLLGTSAAHGGPEFCYDEEDNLYRIAVRHMRAFDGHAECKDEQIQSIKFDDLFTQFIGTGNWNLVHIQCKSFQMGFIQGFISHASIIRNVDPRCKSQHTPVMYVQSSETLATKSVRVVLTKFGITSFASPSGFEIHDDIVRVPFNLDSDDGDVLENIKAQANDWVRIKSITLNKTVPVFDCTVDEAHCFDANGIVVHNCVEVGMYAHLASGDEEKKDHGPSGSQGCNLSEINMKAVTNADEFYDACDAAAIVGTLQAGYTEFPYLGEVTEAIFRREALIGVGMTGMMDTPHIAFNPDIQTRGAEIVKATNARIAAMIGINQAARCTVVKPSGSTSCILGTSSGVHPHHSRKYFRRVQANKLEAPLQFYKHINPDAVEESVWSANKTDDVITFLCEASKDAWIKSGVGSAQLLEHVRSTQENWVWSGTNQDLCTLPGLTHNVSNTITVGPDEWDDVAAYIYDNRKYFAGVSLLSASGDKDYQQAPFQAVMDPAEQVAAYGDAQPFASGLIIHALQAFDNNLFNACACLLGMGEKLDMPEMKELDDPEAGSIESMKVTFAKLTWVARAKKFANRYFEDDVKKMTYCLKDVDAWKTWCDLSRTYKPIIWENFREETDTTNPHTLVACSGDSCELTKI